MSGRRGSGSRLRQRPHRWVCVQMWHSQYVFVVCCLPCRSSNQRLLVRSQDGGRGADALGSRRISTSSERTGRLAHQPVVCPGDSENTVTPHPPPPVRLRAPDAGAPLPVWPRWAPCICTPTDDTFAVSGRISDRRSCLVTSLLQPIFLRGSLTHSRVEHLAFGRPAAEGGNAVDRLVDEKVHRPRGQQSHE